MNLQGMYCNFGHVLPKLLLKTLSPCDPCNFLDPVWVLPAVATVNPEELCITLRLVKPSLLLSRATVKIMIPLRHPPRNAAQIDAFAKRTSRQCHDERNPHMFDRAVFWITDHFVLFDLLGVHFITKVLTHCDQFGELPSFASFLTQYSPAHLSSVA